MEEIWKDIVFEEDGIVYDYRDLYQVSNQEGRIKSLIDNHGNKREKILKARKRKNGYLQVGLSKNGKRKTFYVHRLVAHMFIENEDHENKTQVNHIDENKENNSVENLEWCTSEYNNNYGTHNERMTKSKSQKVIGYSLTESKVIVFKSTRQAEKFGYNHGAIGKCCKGKYYGGHEYKGYKWFYLDDIKKGDTE